MSSGIRFLVVLALASGLLAVPVVASEPEAPAGEPAPMDEEMMAAWQRSMALGDEHRDLAGQAGRWNAEITAWMSPDAPPETQTGTFDREMILGGRVMRETYSGEFGGMPFEGVGLTGYDNVTGQWWSTWTDNMSTGLMVQWGQWDEEAGGIVFHGDYPDPMTGTRKKVRTEIRHLDDGSEVMEMFEQAADGEWRKTMEIRSRRAS